MTKSVFFKDNISFDTSEKSVLSLRDGCLEYLGAEIDQSPVDKVFIVYRTPATVGSVANKLPGIPITNDHVSLDQPVENACGSIVDASLVDLLDESSKTFLAIKNKVLIDNASSTLVESGKRELSLGYSAYLVPSNKDGVDFDQRDIEPHHLAIVDNGRCGSSCAFIDREFRRGQTKMPLHKVFLDDDGETNLAQVVEIATQLPEAMKTVPLAELQKLVPMLKNIINMANGGEADAPDAAAAVADDEDADTKKNEVAEDKNGDDDEDKKGVTDSAAFKSEVSKKVKEAVIEHTNVITKARDFLKDSYSFSNKTTKQIMNDVVKTQYADSFDDDLQLAMAFKIIKKPTKVYDAFGPDNALESKIDTIMNKEY